jgi:hypothetical protein
MASDRRKEIGTPFTPATATELETWLKPAMEALYAQAQQSIREEPRNP